MDRSAPLLTAPILVPTPHSDNTPHPGGSWDNVAAPPPSNGILSQSWDCVQDEDIDSSQSLEHTLTVQQQ